jgi:plasmid stabilization system protein ParE
MTLTFHRYVQRDVSAVIAYYDEAGGPALGDAFFSELMAQVENARLRPLKFHRVHGELRRCNLTRFPYHFLFRCVGDTVRILVVRHNRRHPDHGAERR